MDTHPRREGRKETQSERLTQLQTTGYHVPAVRRRDLFYAKLEDQRAEALGQV